MGLSDEVKAQIEQEAAACGNSFEKSEFVCPKNVVNPGLFFGYMIGATKWAEELQKLKEVNWQKWNDNHCDEVLEENRIMRIALNHIALANNQDKLELHVVILGMKTWAVEALEKVDHK